MTIWVSVLGVLAASLLAPGVFVGGRVLLQRRRHQDAALYLERCLGLLGIHSDGRGAMRGQWRGRAVVAQLLPGLGSTTLRLGTEVPTGALRLTPRRSEPPWDGQLGDPGFDARWCVQGPIGDRGILTGPVRLALERVGARVEIDGGWLIWNQECPQRLGVTELQGVLSSLAWVAEALCRAPASPEARFDALIRREPVAGVRWRALAALALQQPALAERFARSALTDGDAKVRWIAARQLGAAGVLSELCAQDDVAATVRRAAARDLLALSAPGPQLEAARGLCSAPGPALRELAVALAVATGARGEALLIGLLDAPDAAVRRSAAQGLGQIGTIAAVGPLRRRLEQDSARMQVELSRALARIKLRLGEHVGALALSTGTDGALSEIPQGR